MRHLPALLISSVALAGCLDFSEDAFCRDRPEVCAVSISDVQPSVGPANQTYPITIYGVGFRADADVLFDGTPGHVLSRAPQALRVEVPPHAAGFAEVVVRTSGKTAVAPAKFEFVAAPVITEVPELALRGERFVIKGAHLLPNTWTFADSFHTIRLVREESSPEQLVFDTDAWHDSKGSFTVTVSTLGGSVQTPEIRTWLPWTETLVMPKSGTSVHQDPGTPGRAYVVTQLNVYRSDDDGQTWSAIPATVLPPSDTWAFDPPRALVATPNGLYVSNDGVSWRRGAATQAVAAVAVVGSPARTFALRAGKVFETADDGDSWTEVPGLAGELLASTSDRLLVGGTQGVIEYDPATGESSAIWTTPVKLLAGGSPVVISDGSTTWARWGSDFAPLVTKYALSISVNAEAQEVLVCGYGGTRRESPAGAAVVSGVGNFERVSTGHGTSRTWLAIDSNRVYRTRVTAWPP